MDTFPGLSEVQILNLNAVKGFGGIRAFRFRKSLNARMRTFWFEY